ncbi:MAG: hypothetical protein GDA45_00475 [Chromatiales bacterium]|nr:hypothetical protein [Chromatiales bacterium]
MLNQFIIIATAILLFPAAFISLGINVGYSPYSGLGAGLVIALLAAAGLLLKRPTMLKMLGLLILLSLIVISVIVTYQVFVPLLNNQVLLSDGYMPEKSLPLLSSVIALYIFYILITYSTTSEYKQNFMRKLEAILSGPPLLLTLAVAIILSTTILLMIYNTAVHYPELVVVTNKFLARGFIPPLTILLFCWGLILLMSKSYILWNEQRLIEEPNRSLLMAAYHKFLDEQQGMMKDSYIDLIWKKSADFYILPRYFNWSIPILGFIGTVYGISLASDGIQKIIGEQQGLANLSNQLGDAIAPLGIAFDTTLIALSLSIVLTLLQTIVQRWENNLLTNYENRLLGVDH